MKCTRCQNEALPNKKSCAACLQKDRDRRNRVRSVNKQKGLCIYCSEPSYGKWECKECVSKRKKRYNDLISKGICPKCGINPLHLEKSKCIGCFHKSQEREKIRKTRHKENGICRHCGEKVLNNKAWCITNQMHIKI